MEDPFSALLKSLQSVFHLEAMRNGKYIYPSVQQLKEATEGYNPAAQNTFLNLLKAIKECMPHIEKWRINFNSIDWTKVLSHPKLSTKFQFSALNHSKEEANLSQLLTCKTGKTLTQLDSSEVVQALIDNRNRPGFCQKLSAHLKKYPDFLFHLLQDSESNFVKICNTRLILYLTDQQIAKAIIKHLPAFVHKQSEPFEEVDHLIHRLNEILSNGRSVSTLLRNAEVKPILYNSIFFQIYLSDSYQSHREKPSQPDAISENELLKPDMS
jgi:hypothetical protein